jgi:MFS family permease
MEQSKTPAPVSFHLIRSLVSVTVGSLLLRTAAGAMGENIQFYLNSIHDAARSPTSPLRLIAGASHVYSISYTLGGIIIGSFFAAELVGALFFGAWSDRYGRKLFIILGPLFGVIAVQITALTTVIWLLVVTRILEGLSTASNAPATLGYLADATAHSPKLRARAVGYYEIATIGGIALGFSVGGWLWRNFGSPKILAGIPFTSPAFALNAILYLASMVVLLYGVRNIRERPDSGQGKTHIRETLKNYWRIFSSPRVTGFAPAWIAINAVLGIWINLTARILTDRNFRPHQLLVGLYNSFQAGNVRAAYALFFIFGILLWSIFFPHVRRTTAMLVGIGGLFVSDFLLWAINHQPSLNVPLVPVLAVFLVISIMIQSGFTPAALAYLADITEDHSSNRGAIMGLYSVFLGLGQFLGASLGGPFVDLAGADGMILSTVLLGIFAGGMILWLRAAENRRSQMPAQPVITGIA